MRTVICPECGQKTEYSSENVYRPFCSERCQTLDLGAWADEQYSISSNELPDIEELGSEEKPTDSSSKPPIH